MTDKRKRDSLADVIERAWLRRWGKIPVVAQVVLDRLRREEPDK